MIPRFMLLYSPPSYGRYIANTSVGAILSLSCMTEIVQISEQDNIETLLRYFQYVHKDRVFE